MKSLYLHSGELLDNYDTVAEAIRVTIQHWHESDAPCAFTIRDEDDLIEATICPIGSDKATVVWANGQIDHYTGIKYVRSGTEMLITSTQFYLNNETHLTSINF
jgi:hypothetical protein